MALVTVTITATSQVTGLTLVNADTDQDVGPLLPGQSIPQSPAWNVRANAAAGVTRVNFEVRRNGVLLHSQSEGQAPFALCGDSPPGQYNACAISDGPATITATPILDTTTGTPLSVDVTIGPPPTALGEPFSDGTLFTDATGFEG